MAACRYGIFLLVFNLTSHSFAALTRELSSLTLEEKFYIRASMYYSLFVTLCAYSLAPVYSCDDIWRERNRLWTN